MNQYGDLFRLQVKKPLCFQALQALIHHGCRVNGHFIAHIPIRMLQSIRSSYGLQLFSGIAIKRTTGCSQQNFLHRIVCVPLQTLENRRMFTIDWQDCNALFCCGFHHQFSTSNQSFFICKCNINTSCNCCQSRL